MRSDVGVEERGIMVLLEKQVHLQKDVGAGWALARCQIWMVLMYIQAARDNERKERKRRRCFQFSRAIVDVRCYSDLYIVVTCDTNNPSTSRLGVEPR